MDIGFIGLGTMGSRMAANVLKGGHRLWGYDLSQSAVDRASALGVTMCGAHERRPRGGTPLFCP